MKNTEKRRRICGSWYHRKWFRVLLIIVGVDLVILGFAFAIGIDITVLTEHVGPVLRIIFGLMYILAALFLIHYALAYKKIKEDSHFLCHHCGYAGCDDVVEDSGKNSKEQEQEQEK